MLPGIWRIQFWRTPGKATGSPVAATVPGRQTLGIISGTPPFGGVGDGFGWERGEIART